MGLTIVKRRQSQIECHRYGSKIKVPSASPERPEESQALWLAATILSCEIFCFLPSELKDARSKHLNLIQ